MGHSITRSDVCSPRYVEPPPCKPPLNIIKNGRLWVIEEFSRGEHAGETLSTHSQRMDALRAGKKKMETESYPCLLRWEDPDSIRGIYWNSLFEELSIRFDPFCNRWVVVPEAGHITFAEEGQYQEACKHAEVVQEEFCFKHLVSYDKDGSPVDSRDHRFLRHNVADSGVRFKNTRVSTEETDSDDTRETEQTYETTPSALGASVPDVTEVEILDDNGPLHRYESPWSDDQTVQIIALAPDYRPNTSAVDVMSTIIESWEEISDIPHVTTVLESGFEPAPWVVYRSRSETLADVGHDLTTDEQLNLLNEINSAIVSARKTSMHPLGIRPEHIYLSSHQSGYRGEVANWGIDSAVRKSINDEYVTPFTAPEQIEGTISQQTPVYQFGALTYWLFCEMKPFTNDSNLREAILMGEFLSPSVSGNLPDEAASALTKAMSPHPEDRFETVGAFYSAFRKGL